MPPQTLAISNRLREIALKKSDARELMQETVALLQRARPHYNWAGIYLLEGDTLVLGPYAGKPTPHTRIPLNQGICGAAASSGKTIIVDDVQSDPRYLACSLETRSEIVVPIQRDGEILGEIDIDSDRPAAFGEEDRKLLEEVAKILVAKLRVSNPPKQDL
jgi:L-methionine (R)-S-oxide reductase